MEKEEERLKGEEGREGERESEREMRGGEMGLGLKRGK